MSGEEEIDPRVKAGRRVQWTRDRELANALVSTLPSDLYPTEQECITEAVRRHVRQERRGTSPEEIFRQFYDLIASAGGAIPVRRVGPDLVALPEDGEMGVRLGLDEEGWMRVEAETRDPDALAAADPEEMSRAELVAEVERLRDG